jgi:glutamyl-tRNA reductase
MPIIACGINHKTAPVALREKIVFHPEKIALYLQDLAANENIREAVLLSTCNRSEIYCDTHEPERLIEWISRQFSMADDILRPIWYCHEDQKAVEHIMQVACGLDSMVLGEPQILGQMKAAFSESCAAGSVGTQFNRLFQQVFSVAKEVRTNTSIGACPVSMASSAVSLAKQHFEKNFSDAKILLIGAGDTIQLVTRYLKTQAVKNIFIANRRIENAQTLAREFSLQNISFNELSHTISEVDIVISATGSITPIVTKSMISPRKKPLYMVDIAVPRDVDPAISEFENITLYTIDDLKNKIQQNLSGREHAAEKAKEVIKNKTADFISWMNSLDEAAMTIRVYRKQIEEICADELAKYKKQLERGENPQKVLCEFAQAFTNKLLHIPSVQLRQAGVEGRLDILQWAQQLFGISEPEKFSL